jgi:hypothetical protein
MTSSQHVYEVRPRSDKRGVDLISDVLPFSRLWQRARIVFDCRIANDPAMMSSTISVHFTMNDIWETVIKEGVFAMKKSIVLVSVLSIVAMVLVSCASEPQTTTTTTRQTTTTTTAHHQVPNQPLGYRDNNMQTGGADRVAVDTICACP